MRASIKPRRTGLVVFGSKIGSIFTGFLFLIMMTRSLIPSQFGLWEFITDIVLFAAYPTGILTYWATRDVARGKVVGKTTIILNLLTSMLGIVLFLAFGLASYSVIGATFAPFILAIILVPLTYWTQATNALVGGYDPAITGYSLMVSEPAKLLVAYPLLFVFNLKIMGVILAIAVSYFVQAAVSTYLVRSVTTDRVDLSVARRWLKDAHIPAIYMIPYLLGIADTFVASLARGGTFQVGYYQAAFQVATIVAYSTSLSVAIYPLLLRDRSETLPTELLEFSLLFAIPMAAGAMALAPQILFLLSPEYVTSSTALIILSFWAVASLTSGFLDSSLTGSERADLAVENRTRSILKSVLLKVPLVNAVGYAVYLGFIFFLARANVGGLISNGQFVNYWALTELVLAAGLVAVKTRWVRGRVRLALSSSVLLYLATAIVVGLIVHFAGAAFLVGSLGTLGYGLRLILIVILGAMLYFGLLSILDKRVRSYVNLVLRLLGRQ